MSKGEGKRIGIKFTEDILGDLIGNEVAFSITGKEYKYVNGPLVDKTYTVIAIEHHPTEPKSILITVDDLSRFPTVEGELTIIYDASLGTLAGAGGAVESFVTTFTPTDLVPEPNPHVTETITAQPSITVVINDIDYIDHLQPAETLTVSPANVTVVITDVGIIDP